MPQTSQTSQTSQTVNTSCSLNKDIRQIGDICPRCNKDKLQYEHGGYQECQYLVDLDEYLKCSSCKSVFLLKYKQMHIDDINLLACDMHDVMEAEFKRRGMKLTIEKSDEIYNKLKGILSEFSTGIFKNSN